MTLEESLAALEEDRKNLLALLAQSGPTELSDVVRLLGEVYEQRDRAIAPAFAQLGALLRKADRAVDAGDLVRAKRIISGVADYMEGIDPDDGAGLEDELDDD